MILSDTHITLLSGWFFPFEIPHLLIVVHSKRGRVLCYTSPRNKNSQLDLFWNAICCFLLLGLNDSVRKIKYSEVASKIRTQTELLAFQVPEKAAAAATRSHSSKSTASDINPIFASYPSSPPWRLFLRQLKNYVSMVSSQGSFLGQGTTSQLPFNVTNGPARFEQFEQQKLNWHNFPLLVKTFIFSN